MTEHPIPLEKAKARDKKSKGQAARKSKLSANLNEPARDLVLPINLEAEESVLGGILDDNRAYDHLCDYLAPEHFADPANARIYEACGQLIERGQRANAIALQTMFDQDPDLSELGGGEYLKRLETSAAASSAIRDHGLQIRDFALRRHLMALGSDLRQHAAAVDLKSTADDFIEGLEAELSRLTGTGSRDSGPCLIGKYVDSTVSQFEAAFRGEATGGLTTGFQSLDKVIGGLRPGQLIIVAGRPGMGKTALAMNMGKNVAAEDGQTVVFFSLEMSGAQLAARMIAEEAEISAHRLQRGNFGASDFDGRIWNARTKLLDLPIALDETPALTVNAMRTRARRLKRQRGLALIIVDYLQLATVPRNERSPGHRVAEITAITAGLKSMAKDLDVPVLALSQLSRQVEQRDDKRPQLADLRESGSIEQDADVVMFVYREGYYLSCEEPAQRATETSEKFEARDRLWRDRLNKVEGRASIIVAKQRSGPLATVALWFDAHLTRFRDPSDPVKRSDDECQLI